MKPTRKIYWLPEDDDDLEDTTDDSEGYWENFGEESF